jgi:hypothetical protein
MVASTMATWSVGGVCAERVNQKAELSDSHGIDCLHDARFNSPIESDQRLEQTDQ